MAVTKYFEVPALVEGDNEIVPAAHMGRVLQFRKGKEGQLRAVDYVRRLNPPTLAEERHAYFSTASGKPMAWSYDEETKIYVPERPDDWLCNEFRQSVADTRGQGEWTSTFLKDGRKAIEKGKVSYDKKHDLWIIEGGKEHDVELPPDGWTLEYDRPTGFPSRTSQNRKDAEAIFGADTSYFYATRAGLRAVLRVHGLSDLGPFCVDALFGPGDGDPYVGARSCSSSLVEQGSENLATPQKLVYELSDATYREALKFFDSARKGSIELRQLQRDAEKNYKSFSRIKPLK